MTVYVALNDTNDQHGFDKLSPNGRWCCPALNPPSRSAVTGDPRQHPHPYAARPPSINRSATCTLFRPALLAWYSITSACLMSASTVVASPW